MQVIGRLKRFVILGGGLLVWNASAVQLPPVLPTGNPYVWEVTNRNLFQLKAVTMEEPPKPMEPAPLREIKISGITTLPDATRAILRVMRAAKAPETAKEISLFLAPGDPGEDGVQVLDIDVAHGLVRISNSGVLQTLDIAKNAPKASAVPSAAAGLPGPPPRGGVMAVPRSEIPPPPSNEEQTWTMALQRERDLARASAGQIRADDIPPYPPNEVTTEADKEAMGAGH